MVLHIVLFVDVPDLKSIALVTLQAVKLESDNVVVLFPALGSPLGDLVVLEVMVIDLVGGVGGGGRLVNRFSDALVVVFEVGALVLFVVAFVEVFFSSSFS